MIRILFGAIVLEGVPDADRLLPPDVDSAGLGL